MKLAVPQDALKLPIGTLDVVRPTSEGPALEKVKVEDSDVLEAAQLIASAHEMKFKSMDFKSKSEILAIAVNEFDFRREFFEAFAT
jgi:hypothetical protein